MAVEPIKIGNNKFFNDFSSLNGLIDLEFGFQFFFLSFFSVFVVLLVRDRRKFWWSFDKLNLCPKAFNYEFISFEFIGWLLDDCWTFGYKLVLPLKARHLRAENLAGELSSRQRALRTVDGKSIGFDQSKGTKRNGKTKQHRAKYA